jgi:hypothetical protein
MGTFVGISKGPKRIAFLRIWPKLFACHQKSRKILVRSFWNFDPSRFQGKELPQTHATFKARQATQMSLSCQQTAKTDPGTSRAAKGKPMEHH